MRPLFPSFPHTAPSPLTLVGLLTLPPDVTKQCPPTHIHTTIDLKQVTSAVQASVSL